MKTRQEFFRHYLLSAPVAHSLWRCYECERFAQEKLKGPVLDIGCGDGFFAEAVFGHLDAGIDLDAREISRAVKRKTYNRALVGNAAKLPFKNGSFNTVISNCAMEHIPDIDGVLSEVYRVLKPGGRLITSVPSEYYDTDSFYQGIFKAMGFNLAAQWYNRALNSVYKHYHVNDKAQWNQRFKKAGLKLKSSEYIMPVFAFHTFERWLIPAIPSKIWKTLFNRWVFLPRFWVPVFFNWWFKDLLEKYWDKGVCYYFVVAKPRK